MAGTTTWLTGYTPMRSSAYSGDTVYLSPNGEAGPYTVRWLDHRSNVVASSTATSGQSFSNPPAPTYAGLTFYSWCGDASNITEDRDIIAVYLPTDGKRTLIVEASTLAGLTPTLKVTKSDTSTLTVDWGDGTTSTSSASGAVTITKAAPYVDGTYQIKPYISSGAGTFTGGHGTTTNQMLSGVACTEYWANSDVLSVTAYAFNGTAFRTMTAMTGFVACASIGDYAFASDYAIKTIALPVCLTLGTRSFALVYSCMAFVAPLMTAIGDAGFTQAQSMTCLNLPSLATVGPTGLGSHFYLQSVSLPALTDVGSNGMNGCYNIKYLYVPLLVTIGSSGFTLSGYLGDIDFPAIVTLGSSSMAATRSSEKITLGPNCTTISSSALAGCRNLKTLRVEALEPPALASVASLADFDPRLVIQVPAASLATYQAATSWSSFATRMVGY